jgi:acetate kinase
MAAAAHGNKRAELALGVYAHRVRRYIGAYLLELGRCDAIVFTGGVGENAAPMRARILAGLEASGN